MLLEIEGLKVYYFTRKGVVRAVEDFNLNLDKGEALGLVGESGCGKSTLARAIMRLVGAPGAITGGRILFRGEDLMKKSEREIREIRGRDISMVLQDPMTSLDPLMNVGQQIVETMMVHMKTTREEAWDKAQALLGKLGIPAERTHDYPHQFSGGMRQRIAIGLAMCTDPSLILADEPTTALDVIVQSQILKLLKDLKESQRALSWILVTHDLSIVAQVCDKVMVMYAGRVAEAADVASLYEKPLHPYTQGLLKSLPSVQISKGYLESIPGAPPDLRTPSKGCIFHPRCPLASTICSESTPGGVQVAPDHLVFCLRYR